MMVDSAADAASPAAPQEQGTWPLPCPHCLLPCERDGELPEHCQHCGERLEVCGRFRITGRLGGAGASVTYGGTRGTDNQPVAIKVLALGSEQASWTAWELFDRSTKLLLDLEHSALPEVYAYERSNSGRLVLVRESFAGGTLEERVEQLGSRLSPERVRQLLTDLLGLLVYLQELVPPVVHRDIKPSNIMFRTKGDWSPVLVDFDTVAAAPDRRTGHTIVGTPGYAAPEQFYSEATPASDLYGLAATMVFVATHTNPDHLPRKGGRLDLGSRLDGLDIRTRRVVVRMLEPEPSRRFAGAVEALHALNSDPEPDGPQVPGAQAARKWLLGGLRAVGGAAVGILFTLGVVLALLLVLVALMPESESEAMEAVLGECGEGAADACNAAADAYRSGNGTRKDTDRAATLYKKACEGDNAAACNSLAWMTEFGEGRPRSVSAAIPLYRRACELGSGAGCNNLGAAYRDGTGVPRDTKRAQELFERSCAKRSGVACTNAGELYEKSGDPRRALELLEEACELDYAQGCHDAAQIVAAGFEGREPDPEKAFELSRRACDTGKKEACTELHGLLSDCEQGVGAACYLAGDAFDEGAGVGEDDGRAVRLYRKACDAKHAAGCTALGWMTRHGVGTSPDAGESVELYQRACDLGSALGCNNLGLAYKDAQGVERDTERALTLFRRACDDGTALGCYNAGRVHADPRAGHLDRKRATELHKKGCALGVEEACTELEQLAGRRN